MMPKPRRVQRQIVREFILSQERKENNMSDYIVRATAANNQIRAFAITSKDLVEEARKQTQHQSGYYRRFRTIIKWSRNDGCDDERR